MSEKRKYIRPKKDKKFNLTNCIIISNAKRLKSGQEIIKDKRHLSTFLNESEIGVTHLYMMLYRSEKTGFHSINQKLVDSLCKILMVKESELIIKF